MPINPTQLEQRGNLWTGDGNASATLNKPVWVRINSFDGVQFYGYDQVMPAQGGFTLLVGGAQGTYVKNPAYNSARVEIDWAADPYVQITRAYFDNSVANLDWVYVFTRCCGETPIQCIDVVTDWQCIDGVVYLTKKTLCGQFTVVDP